MANWQKHEIISEDSFFGFDTILFAFVNCVDHSSKEIWCSNDFPFNTWKKGDYGNWFG